MIKTDICDLLGIQYPIIQGGMAWVATGELAAAVSNAGGLGVIGAGSAPKEVVREQIAKAKKLTNKPFGVNIYFISPFVDDIVDLVIEEDIKVITTGAGNPGKYISRFKENGIKVLPLVSSIALAKRLERMGVDALIAEGLECGGHVGELTTMAIVPQVVDAVSIPVIAAGGIFDARGLVAALSLGAQGVQMGTRFVCAEECTVHINYKKALIKAKDRDTVLTGTSGHKVRVVRNKLTRTFDELVERNAPEEEFEQLGLGRLRMAVVDGDAQMGSIMAGQIASMIKEVQPAKEIIDEIVTETKEIINKLTKFL